MAYPKWFSEVEYLSNKLAHLQKIGAKDANGSDFTSISQVADALKAAGTDPYSHYNAYGSAEGLSPSVAFDAIEYCQFKLRQLQEDPATKSEWASKNWEDVQYGINKAGMSLGQHYAQYGAVEGVSMSNGFDGNAYLTAKLALLKAADKTYETWSVKQLAEAMKGMGLDPYTHYMTFKGGEGEVGPNATFYPEKPVGGGGSKVSTLTTDADTLSGNVFNAPSVVTMIGGQVDSLQSVDTLTGIGANPTLNVTLADNIVATPVLKGIETINIKGEANAVGLDLSQASGLKTLNADLSRTSLTIEDVQNNITVGVNKANTTDARNDLTVVFADSVVAGAEDVAKVVLTGNGNANVVGTQLINLRGISTGGFETVEITANGVNRIGNVFSDSTVTGNHDATANNSVRTIKVSGEGSLRMDSALTSTTTFDASANKGGVNVTLNNTGNITVTGGEGNDTFNLMGTLTNGDKIDGGEGRDTIRVLSNAGLGDGTQVSNIEILRNDATGAPVGNNNVYNMSKVSSFDAIVHNSSQTAIYNEFSAEGAKDAAKGLTLLNVGDATVGIKGAGGLGASSDTLHINVGESSQVATFAAGTVTANNVEHFVVDVKGAGANTATAGGDLLDAASANSVTYTGGSVGVVFNAGAVANSTAVLTKIDGSEFVGDLTVTGNAFAQTITGGHGDDNISTGGRGLATTNGDVLTGGAGNDTFIFAAADSTAVLPNAAIAGSFTDVQKALFTQITDLNLGGANAATGVDKVNLATVLAVTQANLSVVNGGAATAMTGATFGGAVDALINGGVLDTGGANTGDSARVGLFTWGGETFLIANEAATAATQYTEHDTIVLLVTGVTGTLDASDIVAA